jgi:hypothetical protein
VAAEPFGTAKPVRFAGYAARFDRLDNGGDVVRKGAFLATIAAKQSIPLLWQHKPGVVIGSIAQALDIIVGAVVELRSPMIRSPLLRSVAPSSSVLHPPATRRGGQNAIACWTEGGWRFCEAFDGLRVSIAGTGVQARFDGEAWRFGLLEAASIQVGGQQVVGSRQPTVPLPAAGSVIDMEARSSLAQVIKALQAHGLIATA